MKGGTLHPSLPTPYGGRKDSSMLVDRMPVTEVLIHVRGSLLISRVIREIVGRYVKSGRVDRAFRLLREAHDRKII